MRCTRGKSFQILSKNIKIVLNDKSKKKTKKLKDNLKRLMFSANISNEIMMVVKYLLKK